MSTPKVTCNVCNWEMNETSWDRQIQHGKFQKKNRKFGITEQPCFLEPIEL